MMLISQHRFRFDIIFSFQYVNIFDLVNFSSHCDESHQNSLASKMWLLVSGRPGTV